MDRCLNDYSMDDYHMDPGWLIFRIDINDYINELLGIVIGIIQWIVIFQRMIR